MATSAAVARNLLRNSKSLPQILRGQILGRSNINNANINNMVKDHQIVQSLFVSNQNLPAQMPIFGFSEMGSFLGSSSSGGLSLVEKGDGRGRAGLAVETRGKHTVNDEDEDEDEDDEEEDDDGDFEDYEEIEDVEDFDEDDDDDDDGFYGDVYEYGDDEEKKGSRMY